MKSLTVCHSCPPHQQKTLPSLVQAEELLSEAPSMAWARDRAGDQTSSSIPSTQTQHHTEEACWVRNAQDVEILLQPPCLPASQPALKQTQMKN